jgi:hypothetical protein
VPRGVLGVPRRGCGTGWEWRRRTGGAAVAGAVAVVCLRGWLGERRGHRSGWEWVRGSRKRRVVVSVRGGARDSVGAAFLLQLFELKGCKLITLRLFIVYLLLAPDVDLLPGGLSGSGSCREPR